MKDWLQSIGVATVAALAPIQTVLISVAILIAADLFTGMLAAYKRKEELSSAAMRRTVSKILVYETAIICGFLLETYLLSDLVPISKLVAGVIGLVEFKSILENCNLALGHNIFKTVIGMLGSDNDSKNKSNKE